MRTRLRRRSPHRAVVPAASRVTVRRLVADLRRSREAIGHVEAALDTLLADLRAGAPRPAAGVVDRLRSAAETVSAHLGPSLGALRR